MSEIYECITLDKFNNHAYVRLEGVDHLFRSYDDFASLTGFNYEIINLSFEPVRNFFTVELPGGVVQSGIEQEQFQWILNNRDKIIQAAYDNGYGALAPLPTLQEVRSNKLWETDWMVIRHRDQLELNINTSITAEQYQKLLAYRQELRDITTKYNSIEEVIWPLLDL
jgi:hypothetical protein